MYTSELAYLQSLRAWFSHLYLPRTLMYCTVSYSGPANYHVVHLVIFCTICISLTLPRPIFHWFLSHQHWLTCIPSSSGQCNFLAIRQPLCKENGSCFSATGGLSCLVPIQAVKKRGFVGPSANRRMCWTLLTSIMGCLQRKKSSDESAGNEKKGKTYEKSNKIMAKENGELANQQEELERETKTAEEMQKKHITWYLSKTPQTMSM